jgi:hypothetical protein
MIEQLPADLAALIAAERAAPTASSAVRIAIRAKVATAVAGAPLGVAATGLGVGKVIAIVALTVGAGTAAMVGAKAHASHREVARTSAATEVQARHVDPPAQLVEEQPEVQPPPPAPTVSVQATPAVARSRPVHVAVPSQAERIKQAWNALSIGDPSEALVVVDRDAAEHPIGALSEERDAVQIVALARSGRLDDAKRAADAFRSRYPTSIHLDLIARSLAQESP